MDAQELKKAEFRGPVRFYDGREGMAQQDYECVKEPRFGYSWRRENRRDKGRQFYTVDQREVKDLEEAERLLALPPDPESPAEVYKRSMAEFEASPKLASHATRAQNDAWCNAEVGPFASLRAWMRRTSHPYHVAINKLNDGRDAYERMSWLYDVKSAAHEVYRLVLLFSRDRKEDTHMTCALDTVCRACPILQQIEASLQDDRKRERWPSMMDEADIDAAKAWTCVMHVLTRGVRPMDGVFVWNDDDRRAAQDEADHWAQVADVAEEEQGASLQTREL